VAPPEGHALAGDRGLQQRGVVVDAQGVAQGAGGDPRPLEPFAPAHPIRVVVVEHQQGLVEQGRRLRRPGPPGEIIRAAHREDLFAEQAGRRRGLRRRAGVLDDQIHRPGRTREVVIGGEHADIEIGLAPAQAGQARRQPQRGDGARGAERDGGVPRPGDNLRGGGGQLLEGRAGHVEVAPAQRRQGDTALAALEQGHAQAPLQRADLAADRPLGEMQFRRRLAETGAAGGRLEGPQMLQRRQWFRSVRHDFCAYPG